MLLINDFYHVVPLPTTRSLKVNTSKQKRSYYRILWICFVIKKQMNRTFISELEELVLLSVGVLYPDAYAYSIRKEINEQVDKSLSLASVHTVLYRLEKDGLLQSHLGGKSEKRGGRSKRLFSLSKMGVDTVQDIQNVRRTMWAKMNSV